MLARLSTFGLCLLVAAPAFAEPGPPAGTPSQSKPVEAPDRATLEKEFAEKMTNAVLAGHYVGGRGDEPKENSYHIVKVTKQDGDKWLFLSRIQYAGHDITIPMVIPVKWAGDTAVIEVTDMMVPGSGIYTARVLVYRDHFSGFWSGGTHSGYLWGNIQREPAEQKPDKG